MPQDDEDHDAVVFVGHAGLGGTECDPAVATTANDHRDGCGRADMTMIPQAGIDEPPQADEPAVGRRRYGRTINSVGGRTGAWAVAVAPKVQPTGLMVRSLIFFSTAKVLIQPNALLTPLAETPTTSVTGMPISAPIDGGAASAGILRNMATDVEGAQSPRKVEDVIAASCT